MKVEVASNPVIEGSFTKKEADDLALVLRAGSLPAPIKIEEERMVGPTLGKDSVEAGVTAAIVGGILVLVFMGIYYLYAGLIANFALCLNIIIILGTLSYFNATLTLPGIAGIILTIGMAVDANVLIFERIREELKQGKGIRYAIKGGYHKVFSTILDANLTTLITAFILYKVGTGPIRGFAVTLMIGIVASIFTALVVTRLIFDYLTIKWRLLKNLPMLEILKRERFDFISKRKIAYIVSVVVIASGVIVFAIRGNANFGIDFTGGTLQQIHFENEPDINKVRTSLASVGLKAATISRFGDKKDILIKTDKAYPKEIEKTLNEVFADNKAETVRLERVGPTVGKQLRYKALWAILFAMVAICIYITIRFEFRFAICALIALFHDVLVTLGIFSMSARELSLPIIAAILTIIGYSLNDTIVVFDRIREDLQLLKRTSFKDIVNTSINQTFSRTLITSLTTLIAVLSLYFLGGSVINDFALILLIGVIVGTYSSIFIAAPILVEWQKRGRR
jgi:SecD/SecF fusion protein